VLALLDERPWKAPVAFVAIDGGGGAGKSTLADEIAAARDGVGILHLDDFFLSVVGGPDSVDVERLRREAVDPLARGEPARFRRFEWWGEQLAQEHTVDPGPIVVVEGVFALQPALRSLYDVTVWVETDAAVRLARGLDRDGEDARALWEQWQLAEAEHAAEVAEVDVVALG
jgi:uridine kinase